MPITYLAADVELPPALEQWLALPAPRPPALTLPNDADIAALVPHLDALQTVVLQFPKWVDGRAYSQARLLRVRHRFAGELRASGEVLVDMLPLLARTGFDAVQLAPGQSVAAAQRALGFFAAHYQGDTREPKPLFARSTP